MSKKKLFKKEKLVQFKAEESEWKRFANACVKLQVTSSHVLREFIRSYQLPQKEE